jgi:hypothetical protein
MDLFVTGHDGVGYTSWSHEGVDWGGINNTWRALAPP